MREWVNDHKTMVLLGVEKEELEVWERKLGSDCLCFREPDLGNEATAIAVNPGVDSKLFKGLRLL